MKVDTKRVRWTKKKKVQQKLTKVNIKGVGGHKKKAGQKLTNGDKMGVRWL